MIRLDWLTERLADVLRWQLAHPDGASDPYAPEVPIAGRRVWSIFLALNQTRTGNGFGPNPLSTAEIESYARMTCEPIRPFELDMLRALDSVLLQFARDAAAAPKEPEPPSSEGIMSAFRKAAGGVSSRPLTMPLFDALFAGD